MSNNEKYYIVRGENSGVFFGKIAERNGQEVTMTDVRRLWYWSGASECIQLAAEGVKSPENCKFTMSVETLTILDATEIHPCTPKATANIRGVKEWKA